MTTDPDSDPSTQANRRRLLDVREASAYLNISVRSVWRAVREGGLPHIKLGRLVRIDPDDLDRYVAANRIGPR